MHRNEQKQPGTPAGRGFPGIRDPLQLALHPEPLLRQYAGRGDGRGGRGECGGDHYKSG